MNDLLAGQIDFMFDSATTVPHIKSGKLKGLAVVGPNRLAALPELKVLSAHGIKGVEVASGWHGLFAPAGTPPEIVARLNAEAVKVLAMPKVKDRISALGAEPASSSSAELSKRLASRHRAARPDRQENRRDPRLNAAVRRSRGREPREVSGSRPARPSSPCRPAVVSGCSANATS